jgi:hypothetical protein
MTSVSDRHKRTQRCTGVHRCVADVRMLGCCLNDRQVVQRSSYAHLQQASCPYIVKAGVLPQQALPKEPMQMSTAVVTKIFLRPMMSAIDPAAYGG